MTKLVLVYKDRDKRNQEILGGFEEYLTRQGKLGSIKPYMNGINKFVKWFQERHGIMVFEVISPLDITDFREYLQQEGKSPSTINLAITSLRELYKWMIKEGVVPDNPVDGIKFVSNNPLSPKWLTRSEQAALMRAVKAGKNLRDETMITMLLHTGLRVQELCNLDVDDVTINPRSGLAVVRKGKGGKYREVPLNVTVRKVLSRWLAEHKGKPLFINRYNTRLSSTSVYIIIRDYAYDARIEQRIGPHTLRHTFCKNLLDKGVPLDQVAALAGHASLNTTRIYTMPSLSDLQKAVDTTAWE
jgi:site-specific recombinase XerD